MPNAKFERRTVTFNASDEDLVRRIASFQRQRELKHFVDAVRVLCDEALKMRNVVKNLK